MNTSQVDLSANTTIPAFLEDAPRHLFFTGKGGVGKTSLACASAVLLATMGRKVLIVSTDPASNLDAVLETALTSRPTPIAGVPTRGDRCSGHGAATGNARMSATLVHPALAD